MHVKIQNKLKKWDFDRIAKLLKEGELDQIEIFSYPPHLNFVEVGPLQVLAKESGYVVNVEISFQEPIAQIIFYNMKIDKGMLQYFTVTIESIKLSISKKMVDSKELEIDVGFSLRFLERVINYVCYHHEKWLQEKYIISSNSLDQQIDFQLKEKERQRRGEIPKPFAIIHAKNLKEVKIRAGDLVPLYKGYDKHYLFEEKREYWLLPRSFVTKLVNCAGSNMLAEDRFDAAEREVLKNLVDKNWIKKQVVLGTVYYFGLNKRTEKYLWKFTGKRRIFEDTRSEVNR